MRTPVETMLSLRAMLFLAMLFFSTSALASPAVEAGSIKIISRQVPVSNPTTLSTPDACAQYSRVANLSAIGTNSTIRSAFLEASPVGTMFNSAMLNVMQANSKVLSMDAQLNQACGNLTTVALREVGVNFTMGIVGQFMFMENPVSLVNGPIVILLSVVQLMVFLIPATAL